MSMMSYSALVPAHGYHGGGPLLGSVRFSPDGVLVQPGGVLVLHVPHVVLRGPLPVLNEQLLGLTATLCSCLLKDMTVPTTLLPSQMSRCLPREYKLRVGG